MCDRYSDKHGYICNECFNELTSRHEIVNLEIFMNTPKKESYPDLDTTEYYDSIFVNRRCYD